MPGLDDLSDSEDGDDWEKLPDFASVHYLSPASSLGFLRRTWTLGVPQNFEIADEIDDQIVAVAVSKLGI